MTKLLNQEQRESIHKQCNPCQKFREGECLVFNNPYPLWSEGVCWARLLKKNAIDPLKEDKYEGWKEVMEEDIHNRIGLKFGKSESYDAPLFTKNRLKDNGKISSCGRIKDSRWIEQMEREGKTGSKYF